MINVLLASFRIFIFATPLLLGTYVFGPMMMMLLLNKGIGAKIDYNIINVAFFSVSFFLTNRLIKAFLDVCAYFAGIAEEEYRD